MKSILVALIFRMRQQANFAWLIFSFFMMQCFYNYSFKVLPIFVFVLITIASQYKSYHMLMYSCCVIWYNVKPLSGIRGFSTCVLICVNTSCISWSISSFLKKFITKPLNGVHTFMWSITSINLSILSFPYTFRV